jgi:hypothetical protein
MRREEDIFKPGASRNFGIGAGGMSIEALYEAYMDINPEGAPYETKTPFAEDIFSWLKGERPGELEGWDASDWAAEYGIYLPTWDPGKIDLAERKRDLAWRKARDVDNIATEESNRVYDVEIGKISEKLGTEVSKAREVAGGIGLRSGSLEAAVESTMEASSNRVEDLGDRLMIQKDEDQDTYNLAMVESALAFDKTKYQEKKDFYDRTMESLMDIYGEGGFDDRCTDPSVPVWCPTSGECVASQDDCSDDPIIGPGDQVVTDPTGSGIADSTYCTPICLDFAGMTAGGMSCYDSCLGTPTIGGGMFSPQGFEAKARNEADAECRATAGEDSYAEYGPDGGYTCVGGAETIPTFAKACCYDGASGYCVESSTTNCDSPQYQGSCTGCN